jgi:ferredoxin-thioredoxin reductase catalytic subunit
VTNAENTKKRVENDARTNGYYLTPDPEMLQDLLEGLQKNEERYGYPSCPCRLASGELELDRDIICPCDYRAPDINDYGQCYCALYVRKDIHETKAIQQIPERRPTEKQSRAYSVSNGEAQGKTSTENKKQLKQTNRALWHCQQCGYVCFREDPPYVCPICKAKKEMFSKIAIVAQLQKEK